MVVEADVSADSHPSGPGSERAFVVPSYRSEPLRLGNQVFPSEGLPSPWDRDVDDTMSLLSVAFEHVPELDEERVAILGSSHGGAVALLTAVRDRRIDAGGEFFGPTDFFGEYAREISRRRSKASSAIFPVSSTSTRPSSGPVAHVPGSPRPWAVHPVPGATSVR